ncbi:MAG: enoyl-CoA hydratase/isomerase family protein [Deltaproteobacteria bacterium]|nr:enoyl-CoA hydratase/isomerase family protein [Deltaproteobacteria bacterium]
MRKFEGRAPESFGFEDIIYEKKDWVAKVTINRPDVFNTYRTETLREMLAAFEDATQDDSMAVLVLTGSGDKAFCTGGDVQEYAESFTTVPRDFVKWGKLFMSVNEKLRHVGKPTIARVNGMAVGGGNEFQISCDLAIAAEHAQFFQVGTSVGSVAAVSCWFLPLMIGDRRAREMLLLGKKVDAKTALEWGLVNQVVPKEKLDEAVDEVARQLVHKFPDCMRYTIQQTNYFKDQVASALGGEASDWLATHFTSPEPYEGMNSFVEKRKTDYMKLRKLAAEGKSSEYLWGPPTRKCSGCGVKGIPAEFEYCGVCGKKLK